jgi:microcystin-dependent protein
MQQDIYYLGQICLFPYNFSPRNFIKCDGRLLSTQENTPLYSIIGTTYGGNGVLNFRIPKLSAVSDSEPPFHSVDYYICIEGSYPPRD